MTESFETAFELVFLGTALALLALERVRALQRAPVQLARRWTSNVGLLLIGTLVTAIVIPVSVFTFARNQPPGLMTQAGVPFAVECLLTFLLLDLWHYCEHRVFHRVPLLWRVHLVHHSDTHVDVTTSERHHPFEFLLGTAGVLMLIAAFGLSAPAVGLYLLTATVVALWSHANLRVPAALERHARWLVVTPAVHAIHHSDRQIETDSNFGAVLTLWDRLFGTYSDPGRVTVERYGLAYFHRPADTSLGRVLQQPFLFRRNFDYPSRDASEAAAAATTAMRMDTPMLSARGRDALLGAGAGVILVSIVMWPAWRQLVALWNNEAYQYAWLVLPMVAYLLATRARLTGSAIEFRPDFSGVAVVIVAVLVWGAGTLTSIDIVMQIALVLALQGVALSALGWRSYWKTFPVLALLFLLIPAGDVLRPVLLLVTVKSIAAFTTLAQLPHEVQGLIVHVGTHRYIVADECSGLAYVTLAIFLGYTFGCLLYRSLPKIVALALFSAFLGVFCNVVRVNAIVLIDWLRGTQMDLGAHGNIQWIALFATLLILFYVLSRLRGDAPDTKAPEDNADAPVGARRYAPVMAGASALLVAGSAWALPATELRLAHAPQRPLPAAIANWSLRNPEARWTQGARETQSLHLQLSGRDRDISAIVVENLAADAKLTEVDLGLPDPAQWRNRQARVESNCDGPQCVALMHVTWERGNSRELRHAYYAYSAGMYTSPSTLRVRVAHGWQRVTGASDGLRLIGFVAEGAPLDINAVAASYRTLQAALAPSQ